MFGFIPRFLSSCPQNWYYSITFWSTLMVVSILRILFIPLYFVQHAKSKLSIFQNRHHHHSGSKGNGIIFFMLFSTFTLSTWYIKSKIRFLYICSYLYLDSQDRHSSQWIKMEWNNIFHIIFNVCIVNKLEKKNW